jgi:hypothetical protein
MDTTAKADAVVEHLAELFADHPAWVKAATHLSPRATSTVYFSHRPGETWCLAQEHGRSVMRPGRAADPDFVFRFTPAAVERLGTVEGGIGEFATTLFGLMLAEDESVRVGMRIAAGFLRLTTRGYVKLLVAAGPSVLAFGARHGVATLAGLRRFVADLSKRGVEDWEV